MAVTPLATLAQVKARLGLTLTTAEDTRLTALILDASAAVRSEAGGQIINRSTSTIRVPICGRYALPQHPVVSIQSVTQYVGGAAIAYVFDGLNTLILSGWSNSFEVNGDYATVADIAYTHGYDPTPDDIVAVVAQMAGRAFGLPANDSGVTQESLGTYSVSYGIAAASGGVGMLPDERRIVWRYRRPRAPISMLR